MDENFLQRYKPIKQHFISCSTVETHLNSEPPIILIHGLMTTNSSWNRVKCYLGNRTRRKIYSIDLRNHGKSEYTDQFTVQHLAADLYQFMLDESIHRAILIGHSAGGRAAMEFALRKPKMVEKLVVEDISINDGPEVYRVSLLTLMKQLHHGISQLPPSMSEADALKLLTGITMKYMPKFQLTSSGFISLIAKSLPFYKDEETGEFKFKCNMEVLLHTLENLNEMAIDLTDDPAYSGKTLFIKGEHTVVPVDKDRDLILKHFPLTEFVTVAGGCHVLHSETPEQFSRIVGNFLVK